MDGSQRALSASLRFKLSAWLCLAIVLVAAAAAGFSFVSATGEAHRTQDNQLQQTGYLISRLDAVPSSPLARERAGDIDFDARVVVRFLSRERGLPASMPARAPIFPPSLNDGLQTVSMGTESWRVFVKANDKGVRVAVAQQTTVRDAAARANAIGTLLPILLLVPVLVLLVAVVVRHMFQPLRTLADELGRRPANALGKISHAALPSEVWPFVLEINDLLRRVDQSMTLQRRFIADAAHELRSPMTATSLQAERLGSAELPGEARLRLGALIAGLRRTRDLLEQLLTLARTQESVSLVSAPVSLRRAICEVLEDLVPLAEAKAIDIGLTEQADVDVCAQMVDLKVLVKNLVDNAIRYTPVGGRIDITVSAAGQSALQIDDSGPGIAPEERERVFDPFYRVLGNGEMGSGLGLAISATVAARIGARIDLGDASGTCRGLRVRVLFEGGSAQR